MEVFTNWMLTPTVVDTQPDPVLYAQCFAMLKQFLVILVGIGQKINIPAKRVLEGSVRV